MVNFIHFGLARFSYVCFGLVWFVRLLYGLIWFILIQLDSIIFVIPIFFIRVKLGYTEIGIDIKFGSDRKV